MIALQVWIGWPQWPRQNHLASPHRNPLPPDPAKHRRPLLRAGPITKTQIYFCLEFPSFSTFDGQFFLEEALIEGEDFHTS